MWWVMQPKPIGFGCHIWGAQAPKTTIFFFHLLSHILSKLQLSVLFSATLFWCVCNSFLFSIFFYFSSAFICPRNGNWGQCSFLILLHIHTWELPTVITVLCSSCRVVGASLTCRDFEGKDKKSPTATPLLSQKAQGFELATFQSQNCVYRLLHSFLLWSPCHVYKELLRGKQVWVLWQNHSGQTDLLLCNGKRCQMMLFPGQTQLTPLNSDLDVRPFFRADTVTDGEPSRTQFMSVLAACLEQGEMDQAVTSISTNNQSTHQIISLPTASARQH